MLETIVIGAVGTIIAIILTWLGSLIKTVLENQKIEREEAAARRDLVEDSLQASIRVQLLESYYKIKERGYITAFERDAFDGLYASYIKLGGNSFVKAIYEELKHFPIKDARESIHE